MCQLLGMNCNTPTDVTFSFTGFTQRAGHTGDHSDGWGIAFFEDKGVRHFVDHQRALDSPVADLIRRYPIRSCNVISHIRKATQGAVALQNCHPFVRELWGRYWVFAHNGDLKDFRPTLHGSFHPVGATDSEHAFCWIMQELAKSHAQVPSMAPSISCFPTVRRFGLTPQPACSSSNVDTLLRVLICPTKMCMWTSPPKRRPATGSPSL